MSNPPPPSKRQDNQDAATLTQAQPSTLEEVEARAGRPTTATGAPTSHDDLDEQPAGDV